ncbi:MAG: oxygen-independent coproporphyrinogen III oxidase [Tissierellia bacterium]|nr:oxygen-independent coproporphyrinogen III oxidase [Tissierellia bacterium]
MKDFSLYIHIPFCEKKCYYCDFTSFKKDSTDIDRYMSNLDKEILMYEEILADYKLSTIFIGGGTPSSITSIYIKKILERIYRVFNIEELGEVTIEANPGTLNRQKIKDYKDAGINRVSLGLQSLNDNILRAIGRMHTSKDFLESFYLLREEGFHNINVDLMLGLPGQSLVDLKNTLYRIIDLDVEHISLYSLIIEDGTLIKNWYDNGLIDLPNEDLERLMYHESVELLRQNNYKHYEISNFAKEGYECKHNLRYWKIEPYLGVGLNSHSNLFNKRFWNQSKLINYNESIESNKLAVEGEEIIDKSMEIAEYCIMGLRLKSGIIKSEYLNRFGEDIDKRYRKIIKKHVHNNLIKEDYNSIVLTNKGLDLSNQVEVDFIP